jgi:hypothetical protein
MTADDPAGVAAASLTVNGGVTLDLRSGSHERRTVATFVDAKPVGNGPVQENPHGGYESAHQADRRLGTSRRDPDFGSGMMPRTPTVFPWEMDHGSCR